MQRMIFLLTATCTLLAACSSEPKKPDSASTTPTQTQMTTEEAVTIPLAPDAAVVPVTPVEIDSQKMALVIARLAGSSIYFDYDDYSVKPQYVDLIKQNYQLLSASPKLSINLVGSADERGGTEYNMALGQKRAEAVMRALRILGAPEAQLEAVSYGKENPRATCHEEKCWRENRRVDFAPGTK
jgi:peptidoglycan-associated lipoprotein